MSGKHPEGFQPDLSGVAGEDNKEAQKAAAAKEADIATGDDYTKEVKPAALPGFTARLEARGSVAAKSKAADASEKPKQKLKFGFGVNQRNVVEGNAAQVKEVAIRSGDLQVEAGQNRTVKKLLSKFFELPKFELIPLGDGKRFRLELFVPNGLTYDLDKEFQGPFDSIMKQLEKYVADTFPMLKKE